MLLSLCLGCFFFFFKQKTAYEMRISDWSSDVCSSDLLISKRRSTTMPTLAEMPKRLPAVQRRDDFLLGLGEAGRADWLVTGDKAEIGRASCRERVCQYV